MKPSCCKRFKGMTKSDIDRVMASFELKNCVVNRSYIDILSKNMK